MENELFKLEKIDQLDELDDKDELEYYDFVLRIIEGQVVPIRMRKNKINLEIYDDKKKKCIIDGENYEINSILLKKIKEYININFNKLVYYSMIETNDFLAKNELFGSSKNIFLKIGQVTINLNGEVEGEITEYVNDFINNIILLIKGE